MSRTTGSGPVLCLNSVNPIKKQTQNRSVILCVTAVGKFSCLVSFLISPFGSFLTFSLVTLTLPSFTASYTILDFLPIFGPNLPQSITTGAGCQALHEK